MPQNEFDLLVSELRDHDQKRAAVLQKAMPGPLDADAIRLFLNDVDVVSQLRATGELSKGFTIDEARRAIAQAEKPARRGPLFQELPARGGPVPRQPSKQAVGARVRQVMEKAMNLFAQGAISAEQVSKLEATCHRLAGARR